MGQLSEDGRWWWNGSQWTPAQLSPDGAWHWDGAQWCAVPGAAAATAAGTSAATSAAANGTNAGVIGLDEARLGEGPRPIAGHLPDKPIIRLAYVAIGWGWVARRVIRWHVVTFPQIQSVALVPPESQNVVGAGHPGAGLPELAIRTFMGEVLRIEVPEMNPLARKELLSQVPMSASVTAAAEMFLETGKLPGDWGRRMEAMGLG
jgi:hypothetical protein